jgi:Putative Flp pilus-assembly TadE/G-like
MLTTIMRKAVPLTADETGAVMVFVAVFMPVAILFALFVVDVGRAFEHQQHLQLQADAGALAAAQAFQFPCSAGVNEAIRSAAQEYDGSAVSSYNPQVSGTEAKNIHEQINKKTYYQQASPVDKTVVEREPCEANMIDVKLTETGLPLMFKALNVPHINAHARVEIRQKTTDVGAEPIAINENTPRAAKAYFVNEANGEVLGQTMLTDQGPNGSGEELWDNNGAPVTLPIKAANVGVRIALSGDPHDTNCPPDTQLVRCFDSSSNNTGLVHIQGWSSLGTGSATSPKARSVTLSQGTCSDGYFSNTATDCSFGVQAHVDLGAAPNPPGVTVSAVVPAGTFPLAYNASGPYTGLWTGNATLKAGSGSTRVDLQVKCNKNVKGAPCGSNTSVTIEGVQRSYSAGENSGSIHSAGISEEPTPGNLTAGANSFELCETGNTGAACEHKLVVAITTTGSLGNAQKYSDPLYTMRFGGGTSASQTGAIQCPPGGQGGFKENLEKGCEGTYAPNPEKEGWKCPDELTPKDCVATDNGLKTGQLRQGLTARITNPTNGSEYYCKNEWTEPLGGGVPVIKSNDSRIITVFVTSYGSFGGSGVTWYPIQTFATFYVTGWDGDPCKSDDTAGKDQVVGHFIKYVTLDTTGGGTTICEANAFGQCVAVLTQ